MFRFCSLVKRYSPAARNASLCRPCPDPPCHGGGVGTRVLVWSERDIARPRPRGSTGSMKRGTERSRGRGTRADVAAPNASRPGSPGDGPPCAASGHRHRGTPARTPVPPIARPVSPATARSRCLRRVVVRPAKVARHASRRPEQRRTDGDHHDGGDAAAVDALLQHQDGDRRAEEDRRLAQRRDDRDRRPGHRP